MRNQLSAYETALLVLQLLNLYGEDKSKIVTRARISGSSIRRISGKYRIDDLFLKNFSDELSSFGWIVFPVGDNFALLRDDVTVSWPRISSRRVWGLADRIRNDEEGILDELYTTVLDAFEAKEEDENE